MPLSKEKIQKTLLNWMSKEDNPWTIWYGANPNDATQLVNIDGSNAYVRQEQVSPEIMAYDTTIKITTEIYRVTVILPDGNEPQSGVNWWLQNGEAPKKKIDKIKEMLKAKTSRWHIYFKRG